MDATRNSLLSFSELVLRSKASWAILLGCLCGQTVALAQTSGKKSSVQPQSSSASSTVPDGRDGLPGLYRVGVPATDTPRLGTSLWLDYGYTEAQNEAENGHHRISSSLAVGGAFLPYLSGALRLDFRHDVHGSDATGENDSGSVLDLTPILRAGVPIGGFRLGMEGRANFSGAASSSSLAPPAVDTRLLASWLGGQGWLVSLYGGFRTAQTGSGMDDAGALRPGDRVALGLSEFPAALMGIGAEKSFGSSALFAEGTYDLLVGKGAPPAGQSPMRVALGIRQKLIPGLYLHGIVEASPGGRAPSTVEDPVVPIEPRVSAILGLSVRLPDIKRKARLPEEAPLEPPEEPTLNPTKAPPTQEERSEVRAALSVQVVDETGHPISDAKVKLILPGTDKEPEREVVVPLHEVNVYKLDDLPLGDAEVTIEAELLEGQRRSIELKESTTVEAELKKATGVGSQLQGLVRAYSGEGLQARISVAPGNHATTCDESGEFVLDLPPGSYSVTIEAEGYATQKRRLRVRKEGVTVLNADLQRKN